MLRLRRAGRIHYCSRRAYATKPSLYGQPLNVSHPHIVGNEELTPGFSAGDYENRRSKLMESLPDGSIVLAVAAPIKYMSGNVFHQYRQASDFWYLTGFEEPNSAVVLTKTSEGRGYDMTLFSTGNNRHKSQWDGSSTPIDEIPSLFAADSAYNVKELATFLSSTIKSKLSRFSMSSPTVYVDMAPNLPKSTQGLLRQLVRAGKHNLSQAVFLPHLSCSLQTELTNHEQGVSLQEIYQASGLANVQRKSLAPEVARLRAVKSEAERKVMKIAADISAKAHAKTMRLAEPGLSESVLAAHFEYISRINGAQRIAYVPVVASGANGLVIHYTSNNHIIEPDEMVLIDAGCEYNGYASDITRTFPASGTFTSPQRDLYSAVLRVQRDIIKLCTASSQMTIWDLHQQSYSMLREELRQLGFDVSNDSTMSKLYPHMVSHMIGLDLHETHARDDPLRAGNVLTVEPGIYVPPTSQFPCHFHNLAVRIEDVVLVGETDPVVLSANAPKEARLSLYVLGHVFLIGQQVVDVEGACQGTLGLQPF